jgi:hypothetical protein
MVNATGTKVLGSNKAWMISVIKSLHQLSSEQEPVLALRVASRTQIFADSVSQDHHDR